MAKQLLYTDDARKKLLAGADTLAKAVGSTLGPTGRNVIIEKSFGGPTVTKDGVTVSKEIELPHPFENMGAKLINTVASKTGDVAGDGTTTAVVLAEAIFTEGLKYVTAGVNAVQVQRGKVRAVGPGRLLKSGTRAAIGLRVGDEVLFGKYSGTEVTVNEVEFKILRESEILAKVG